MQSGTSGAAKISKSNCNLFYLVLMNSDTKRITIDPQICHGKPIVRGMRWPVEVILDMLGSGMTPDEIISDHPELEKEDILACLKFARLFVSGQTHQFGSR